MKTLKQIARIVFLMLGILSLFAMFYERFTNIDKTDTRLFVDNWYLVLMFLIFFFLAAILTESDE